MQSTVTIRISQRQAFEIAEKYLLIKDRVVLNDHITVTPHSDGWQVTARTTPAILGKSTELIQFTIDGDSGAISMSTSRPG